MSIGIDGATPWRANVERFEGSAGRAYTAGNAASPWQALLAKTAGSAGNMIDTRAAPAARPFADTPAIANPWQATVVRAGTDNDVAARTPAPAQLTTRPWQAIVSRAAEADASIASATGQPPSLDPAFDVERWRPKVEPTYPQPAAPTEPENREPDDPNRIETAEKKDEKESTPLFASKEGFTFDDFLDIINPLQHIPLISTLYRELTGDQISPGARVIGGGLFMGPVGAALAVGNVMVADATGRDVGEHVVAFFRKEGETPATEVAANSEEKPAGAHTPANDPAVGEKVLAELLPPGAVPIIGNQVDFTTAALRPSAFSTLQPTPAVTTAITTPTTGASAYAALQRMADARLATTAPSVPAASTAAISPKAIAPKAEAIAAPAVPATPVAEPIVPPAPTATTAAPVGTPVAANAPAPAAPVHAGRALSPDPMNQLAARRSPGAMATNAAAATTGANQPGANQTAANGGWFGDVMLQALSKYEGQNRRNTGASEGAPTVNSVH